MSSPSPVSLSDATNSFPAALRKTAALDIASPSTRTIMEPDDEVGDGCCPALNGSGGYSLPEHKDNHGACTGDDEVGDGCCPAQNGSGGYSLPDNHGACNGDDGNEVTRRRRRSNVWFSCTGVRVNFQGHKFTIRGRVKFNCPLSKFYDPSLKFDVVLHALRVKELSPEELLHNLCDAIIFGDDKMAKELVNGLGSVNFCDPFGCLPLVCAVERRNMTMVLYLLENGTDVQVIDIDGVSPPTLAGMALNLNNITSILQQVGGMVDLSWKAIEDSIKKDQPKKLDYLFKAGASMNQRNANGRTILMYACQIQKRDAVAQLLRGEVSINDTDEKGRNALMQASSAGNIQELDQLLHAKASLDLRDSKGQTALMLAQRWRDSKGQTALMLACLAEHVDIVARL